MKRDIRLLIRSLSIVLLLVVVADILVGVFFQKISDIALSKAPNAMRTEYTIKKVDSDVIILGSSRANHHYIPSIVEDSLSLSTFNCGKDGKPFYYSAAMFDAISKRYTPKIVIIDIEPNFLSSGFADYDEVYELYPFYNENDMFKKIIHKKSRFENIKIMSSMYKYNSRFIAIFGRIFLPDYISEKGYMALPNKGYKYPELISKNEIEINDSVDEFTVSLLNEIIHISKEKNIKLIFSISPRYSTLNYKGINSYKELIHILEKTNVHFYDNGGISLISNNEFYKDGAHLNDNGARVFTSLLINQIKQRQ